MSQTTGEEMLNRINATLGVLQDAQEEAVNAVRDVATHKIDPQAHGEAIAAAVKEALDGASGGGSGESGEDGGQLADRLAALEGRFDGNGTVLAANLPLTDAVNSATSRLAASDTAVKTAYDKAVAAATAASTATTTANNALTRANQAVATAGGVTLKGSRSTIGNWTLSGLTVGKPLYILASNTNTTEDYSYVFLKVLSGAVAGTSASTVYARYFFIGCGMENSSTNTFITIPTAATVVIGLTNMQGAMTLRAYQ